MNYAASSDGLKIEKTYQLSSESSYMVDSEITLSFPEGRSDWGYLAVPVGSTSLPFDAADPLQSWEVVGYQNESVTRKAFNKIKDGDLVQQGNTGWLAFGIGTFPPSSITRCVPRLILSVVFSKSWTLSRPDICLPT